MTLTLQSRSVLTVGECMVEVAPSGSDQFTVGFAGDTFNTAWYTRRLLGPDWDVSYATKVGSDAISDRMVGFMEAADVGTGTIARHPDRTVGLYMIQLADGERSFSYWRGESAARTMGDDPAWLDRVLEGRGLILFSGITLAILGAEGREVFCDRVAAARAAGAHVAFDTNLRPRLWKGPEDMRAGLALGASVADTVLPSFDEEQSLYGDTTPSETVARYRELGASLVAVKNGTGPLNLWHRDAGHLQFQPTPAAHVIDSTAAGDSFNAGLLCALAQGKPLEDAARAAMAVSAQVVQGRGALVPVKSE